ncbi:uncharacterized protein JCM10292_004683, partial [Rhodotorula paludigena]|uniref:uncharacterized protein n=1 Tax=Rhodotorula paludigena TaxID=86838 RepID=UPI0031769A00
PPRSGKNVASSFAKSDAQSHLARRVPEPDRDRLRETKRRRLLGDENAAGQSDGTRALASAPPEGKVRSARHAPQDSATASTDATGAAAASAAPDPLAHTLVIHPGSRWLRIGRASDLAPVAVPNVIARKTGAPVAVDDGGKGKGREVEVPVQSANGAVVGAEQSQQREQEEKEATPPLAGAALPPLPSENNNGGSGGDVSMAEADDDADADAQDWDSSSEADASGGGAARKPRAAGATDPLSAKIASLRGDLRARMRAYKLRGQGNGNSQAATYNESVRPQDMEEDFEGDVEWTTGESEVWVGNKAVRIPDAAVSGYSLRWPFSRGGFNTQPYRSSPQELLGDVQAIYTHTLRDELGIEAEDIPDYGVIFLIPDLYDEVYVREMSELLLRTMGFKQLCLIQESVAATFGAGLSSACVIDIGSRTSSITCIEEGLVLPESRMLLDFGGDDVTTFLLSLLQRIHFPYKEADLTKWYDWVVIEELKERLVVLSEGDIGLNLYDFYVRHPGLLTKKYSMRVYDDCILAPYALFAPRVIDFEQKRVVQHELWDKEVDSNVEIGASDVTTAMRNSVKHLLVGPAPPAASASTPALPAAASSALQRADSSHGASPAPGSNAATPALEDPNSAAFSTLPPQAALPALPSAAASLAGSPAPENGGTSGTPKPPAAAPAPPPQNVDVRFESSKLPLDVAVVESILAAGPAEERLKKVAANLLIVGGTGGIHNVGFAVQSRVAPVIMARVPAVKEVQYVPCPKEIEPENVAWKGVGALGRLEGAQDLWVRREEYEALGMRAVRERCFYWA